MKNNFLSPVPFAQVMLVAFVTITSLSACHTSKKTAQTQSAGTAASTSANAKAKTFIKPLSVDRAAFVAFAKKQLGIPYRYGSAVPANGLDCSGFVYYVFQHFGIASPRTTVSFTNEGREVNEKNARVGDLILFTGSDHSSGIVGHMGIITENKNGEIMFIHSASGKNIGVIINKLTGYYRTHFVKIISVFV